MQLKINNDIEKQMALAQLKIILDALEIYDGIKTDIPVVSVSQNNINTNKVSEVIGEELGPISNKETDTNWGGKRSGAGRKKGPQGPQTQEHIDKRIAKLKETAKQRRELRNAAKNTDGAQ